MSEFLLFTLHAPLASWGDIAVGETRGSWDRPSRSAVLGLLAAALGLTRDEQERHDALDAGYGVAVRLDAPGTPLVDYHTTQLVASSAARRAGARTRAELLRVAKSETMLSRRAYRQDALATVALWARPTAAWSLDELAAALRRPVFVPYAGRKANVFGLPFAPEVIEAPTLAVAFRRRAETRGVRPDAPPAVRQWVDEVWRRLRPRDGWGREVAHDRWDGGETGFVPLRREVRRDASPHRARWHFADRSVDVALLPEAPEQEGRA
ncbi:MAG: type I-E CRISPR-associated protein Cas5/CasD [Gemmatimonadetes bacterium]|nr:type I-E CRISPR-associated protein Cas5/CasD [Gemmatimonadota bacterium]